MRRFLSAARQRRAPRRWFTPFTRRTSSQHITPQPKHPAESPLKDGKCPILSLPSEIRLQILRLVLVSARPVEYKSQLYFYLEINHGCWAPTGQYEKWGENRPDLSLLKTCRKLYEEGTDIFFGDNTFGITLMPSVAHHDRIDMLGMRDIPTAFTTTPALQKCRNIRISLHLGNLNFFIAMGFLNHKSDWIDQILKELRHYWRRDGNLEVIVDQLSEDWKTDDRKAREFLSPFGLLRCRKVTFHGVPLRKAETLTRLMESDQPVFDLSDSFRDLREYLMNAHRCAEENLPSLFAETYTEAQTAAYEYNRDKFVSLRREIVAASIQKSEESFAVVVQSGLQLQEQDLTPISDEVPFRLAWWN